MRCRVKSLVRQSIAVRVIVINGACLLRCVRSICQRRGVYVIRAYNVVVVDNVILDVIT